MLNRSRARRGPYLDLRQPIRTIRGFGDFQEISYAKKLSQNREDPRYVVVSNMSRNPYHTVGISLILLVDETRNEKADGRQCTNFNTLDLAG